MQPATYEEVPGGPGRQGALEARVLARWGERDIFGKAQARRAGAPRFTFYEGPPTANGRPGIHHVLARTLKDAICRYQDLVGFHVERKGGWDTHGLPVEVEVEKRLGIHGKDAIRAHGVEAFTRACLDSVFAYVGDWERLTKRIGYWLDLESAYVTYHEDYVESVWWSLAELFRRGLLYKSHKVVWWWPQGGTALSSAEVGLGYRSTQDPSAVVRLVLEESLLPGRRSSLLVWTTTPWTLPSNVAAAVAPDLVYGAYEHEGELLVVAEARAASVLGSAAGEPGLRLTGRELIGRTYSPLYTFATPSGGRAYEVVGTDFVTTDTGTGIVHLAPAFGEDDARAARELGLGFLQLVRPDGRFTEECGPWAELTFKEADREILRDLRERGLLHHHGTVQHEYPFCWRAPEDPLIQYARESWFIRTTAVRDRMLEENARVQWFPEHIRDGRFGDFLRNNVDWALSRERFWGTPLPIWVNDETGRAVCVGSVAELLERNPGAFAAFESAQAADPSLSPHLRVHKPWIDGITFTESGEPGVYRRVPDVIDCWYDSGAMPFAQRHHPFENRELFAASHPADFICEGLDQTRGWFYSLLAISTLLFDRAPYRRVMVNGLVLDKQGRKMSKSLGNAVDPWKVIEQHGSDPLRLYLLSASPPWAPKAFDPDGVAELDRRFFGTLWPSYNFLALYARAEGWSPSHPAPRPALRPAMDRWLLSRTASRLADFRAAMDAYDVQRASRLVITFVVDELSNWYIRRNRPRFWRASDPEDQAAAFATLHEALRVTAFLLAPLAPLSADALFEALHPGAGGQESVHLGDLPVPDPGLIDAELEARMGAVLEVVRLGRAAREAARIRVRQPLLRLVAAVPDARARAALETPELGRELREELNVKELEVAATGGDFCTTVIKPNLPVLGPKQGRRLGAIRTALRELDATAVARFETEGHLDIQVDGESVRLGIEDVLLERTGRPGFAVAAEGGFVAALDTTLTPELIQEGLARELINRVQNQRKAQGLAITDRIRVRLAAPPALLEAARRHEARIRDEVLAETLELDPESRGSPEGAMEHEVEGHRALIAIRALPAPRA
jgi:isoleucyl-tRNA synthetase